MKLGDILYIVFRHKWKILFISVMGIVGAILLPKVHPASYQSEAKLYIRYILENKNPGETDQNDPRIKSIDSRGDSIINNELEILTSLDLAQQVAQLVGPDRILGKPGASGDKAIEQAALVIQANLEVEPTKNSSVIHLLFKHKNPDVTRPVLQNLIECYFKKHTEIHAVGAFDEALTQETDQLRTRLAQTEEDLRKAKNKVGIISLADSQKAFSDQISKIQQEILDAEAELAESQGAVRAIASFNHTVPATPIETNTVAATATNDLVVPPEKLAEYRQVTGVLQALRKKEQDLLVMFTPASSFVRDIREQISTTEKQKRTLEAENPGLTIVRMTDTRTAATPDQETGPRAELVVATARVTALESKMKVLTAQLEKVRKQAMVVDDAQASITDLQRRKEIEEADYRRYHESLKKSEIDERLGAGKVSNISIVQAPSTPLQNKKKLQKAMAGVLFGGIGAGFGLAFLIEFLLDQTVRRTSDLEGKLGVPLFMSIPRLRLEQKPRKLLNGGKHKKLLAQGHEGNGNSEPAESPEPNGSKLELSPWDPQHSIQPFSEALRDRLITYFEMKNLTHNPKLVALTGCASGSGVSTLAAGLAASLSETGEGNVLLVDMNQKNGAAHHFYKGDLACDLDDALEAEKRSTALVQEKLYVVSESETDGNLPRILPKRFKNLVPRLKASDFDYIIFDMPPINQISLTPRLAKFMDMVLVVVESEKTDRELLKRALGLVGESKANLGLVLNKHRSYVPRSLQPQF